MFLDDAKKNESLLNKTTKSQNTHTHTYTTHTYHTHTHIHIHTNIHTHIHHTHTTCPSSKNCVMISVPLLSLTMSIMAP